MISELALVSVPPHKFVRVRLLLQSVENWNTSVGWYPMEYTIDIIFHKSPINDYRVETCGRAGEQIGRRM
jgi:hypothetical protein